MQKLLIIFRLLLLAGIVTLTSACPPSVYNAIPSLSSNDTDDFMFLAYEISNDARLINTELRFIYDEKYNATQLRYKIYADDGSLIFSDANQAFNIKKGRNYIVLSLAQSNYNSWSQINPLLLVVTDPKQQKQYLKFNYTHQ